MLVVDGATVRRLLPVASAIEVMRDTFRHIHEGDVYQPLRSLLQPPGIPGVAVVKPAAVVGTHSALGMKIVTQFNENAAVGLEAIQGVVLLLDPGTGAPIGLLEAGAITEIRTAAVSALATDLLARGDAGDLAVLGAGVQARAHMRAMAAVRSLRRVRIWNRTREKALRLAGEASDELHIVVEVADSIAAATEGADLICTTTSSPEPLLLSVVPGAHVNAVGAFQPSTRELGPTLVAGASIFVDNRESALAEAGDLLLAAEEGCIELPTAISAELSQVVVGAHPGRKERDEVTVFESLGLAIEDLAAAVFVLDRARLHNEGAEVSFS